MESQLLLRRCTVVGTQLLLLWSLSPLGGQASLQALQRAVAVSRNATPLRYLYTGPYATFLVPGNFTSESPKVIILSVLMATQRMKVAPRDTWGIVRVPRFDMLPTYDAADGGRRGQCHSVPRITEPERYAALVGVPVVGLPAAAAASANITIDFTLEASYMSLACGTWATFPEGDARLAEYKRMWGGLDPLRSEVLGMKTTFFLDADMPSASAENATVVVRDPRPRILFFRVGRSRQRRRRKRNGKPAERHQVRRY
jgi:hypothetical protein